MTLATIFAVVYSTAEIGSVITKGRVCSLRSWITVTMARWMPTEISAVMSTMLPR